MSKVEIRFPSEQMRSEYVAQVNRLGSSPWSSIILDDLQQRRDVIAKWNHRRPFLWLGKCVLWLAAVAAQVTSMRYGWNSLAAPSFGTPLLTLSQVLGVFITFRMFMLGSLSIERVRKSSDETKRRSALLWLDRYKEDAEVHAANLVLYGFFAGVVWLLTF